MIKMNNLKVTGKRGDIPVMILVLGVFAICAIVIASIVGVETRDGKYSPGFSDMDEMNSLIGKYNFYTEIKMPDAKIDKLLGVVEIGGERYLIVEGKGFIVRYPLDNIYK